jgi:presenilin 1
LPGSSAAADDVDPELLADVDNWWRAQEDLHSRDGVARLRKTLASMTGKQRIGAHRALQSNYEKLQAEIEEEQSRISLGLGDFVIYSVIAARAAESDFIVLVSCILAMLCGLAGTLGILTLFKKALPALPFSVLLGVVFYLTSSLVLDPFLWALRDDIWV